MLQPLSFFSFSAPTIAKRRVNITYVVVEVAVEWWEDLFSCALST